MAELLSGGGVPQSHCAVVAGGGEDGASVGECAEGHRGDRVGVAGEGLAELLSGGGVPQSHCAVVAGGGEQGGPVGEGTEGHRGDRAGVAGEGHRAEVSVLGWDARGGDHPANVASRDSQVAQEALGAMRSCILEIRATSTAAKNCSGQVGALESRAAKLAVMELGPIEPRGGQVSVLEIGVGDVGIFEACAAQRHATQHDAFWPVESNPSEVRPIQDGSRQAVMGVAPVVGQKRVTKGEFRALRWILRFDGIESRDASSLLVQGQGCEVLPEKIEGFRARHR